VFKELHLQLFHNGLAYWGVVMSQYYFPSTDKFVCFIFVVAGGIFIWMNILAETLSMIMCMKN